MKKAINIILKCGMITWVLLLLIWQFGSLFYSDDFLPGPITTFAGAGKLVASGDLLRDILISMQRVLKGWLLGIVFAIPAGLCIGYFKKIGFIFEPFLNFFRFVPAIGFITLFLMWFGVGEESKVALIFYATIFPVMINTIAGVRTVDSALIEASESLGATAAYYGMVSFMDEMTGKVLDALKEAVRIPMIVAGPDIPEGKKVDALTSIVDIYPTLLDFYNLKQDEREKKLPGISLKDTIEGKAIDNRTIYSEYFSVGYAHSVFMVRKEQYKLVYYVGHDVCQLFDLIKDPDELHDLGAIPDYADKVKELKEELYRIADPEKLDEESLKDQAIMVEERGGIEHILASRKSGCVPFTPVPEGFI
ncbi:MAG: DUF4976 domain-containing protein [Clostridiales bacterium]|nr:DUF4976 domain-containing protein [Clostridiales bacterium]